MAERQGPHPCVPSHLEAPPPGAGGPGPEVQRAQPAEGRGGERESTDVEAHRTPRGPRPQAAPATPRRGVYRQRAQRESQRQDTEPRAAAKQEGVPPCPTWHPRRPAFHHPP